MSLRANAPGQTQAAPAGGIRRALVTGWFSFVDGEATAGDLMSATVAADWLEGAGIEHDTVLSPILRPAQTFDDMDPGAHSHLVFVCGPLAGRQVQDLADRFGGAVTIAVGVSVVDAGLAESFDVVIPRDGPDGAHPDLAFAARPAAGPVVGVVRANQQPEYQASAHDRVHMVIDEVLDSRSARLRPIDTRVDPRIVGQRSAAEVESQFAGLDAVVTTRLHGLVLGLRCGVPVVAVDPIPGGAKVAAQARAVGWPAVMDAESLDPSRLADMLAYCLSSEARERAATVLADARRALATTHVQLRQAFFCEK